MTPVSCYKRSNIPPAVSFKISSSTERRVNYRKVTLPRSFLFCFFRVFRVIFLSKKVEVEEKAKIEQLTGGRRYLTWMLEFYEN